MNRTLCLQSTTVTATKPLPKVGINGFGRIGRTGARVLLQRSDAELVAINDPFLTIHEMESFLASNMFKKDLASSGESVEVAVMDDKTLLLGRKQVAISACRNLAEIPWGETGAEYILETTGKNTSKDEAAAHLKGGAKKVIICAPSDAPMFIFGANEKDYNFYFDVVSAATPATNSVASLAMLINDKFGIREAIITSSYHPTPVLQNNSTGGRVVEPPDTMDVKDILALGQVAPSLGTRFTWKAYHHQITNASMVELTVRLKKCVTYDHIKRVVKEESEGKLKGIIGYTDAALAATDVVGDSRSCVFYAKAGTKASNSGDLVKLVGWQDENWAYCNRVVDLMKHMSQTNPPRNKFRATLRRIFNWQIAMC